MNKYVIQTIRGDILVQSETNPVFQINYVTGGHFLEVGSVAQFRAEQVLGWSQVPVDPVPSHE